MIDNPRSADSRTRNLVLERDNYVCRYCGSCQEPFHMDHVYPYSLGGETSIDNIVTACSKCNQKKHNKVGIWPKPIGYFDKIPYQHRIHFVSLWGILFIVEGLLSNIISAYELDIPLLGTIGWLFFWFGVLLFIVGYLFVWARNRKGDSL